MHTLLIFFPCSCKVSSPLLRFTGGTAITKTCCTAQHFSKSQNFVLNYSEDLFVQPGVCGNTEELMHIRSFWWIRTNMASWVWISETVVLFYTRDLITAKCSACPVLTLISQIRFFPSTTEHFAVCSVPDLISVLSICTYKTKKRPGVSH